jgi:hypothetical protein
MNQLEQLRAQLDKDWLRAVHDGYMGSEWALVLQRLESKPQVIIAALLAV